LIEENPMTPFLFLTLILLAQPAEPLRFHESRQIVAQLPAAQAAKLPLGRLTPEQGENILVVALLDDATKKPGPTMLGKYERAGNELSFTPRFPLGAGQTYRATRTLNGETATLDYRVPAAAAKTPPKIVKVYPTADVLPANHLKFYIYFDRPMRGGKELFDHIVLVDDKGKEIADPWLIDEIWDEENNCLILYILRAASNGASNSACCSAPSFTRSAIIRSSSAAPGPIWTATRSARITSRNSAPRPRTAYASI
jgi:hypothetical protein